MSTEITVGTPAMVEIDITNRGSTVGPQGPQGIQGIQGLQGPAGAAGSNATVTEASIAAANGVTLAGVQTLTNKTLALDSNTISGTLAQFNAAVTDADLVSLTGGQTLSNKYYQQPYITYGLSESYGQGYGGTSYIFQLVNGSIQTITLNNAIACTLTLPTPQVGMTIKLCVKWSLATGSITWPATVRWPGGVAPTLTKVVGKADFFMFHCPDCMYWYGQTIGMNYPQ